MLRRSATRKTGVWSKAQPKRALIRKRGFGVIFMFLVIASSMALVGSVSAQQQASVTVNPGNIVGTNKLSLGFQLVKDWTFWVDRSVMQNLAEGANFRLVRLFDWVNKACTRWNETAKSGTFDWTQVDLLVQRIFEVGAEPFITLGWARPQNLKDYIPVGMSLNSNTGLPYPNSWAAYCREWVKHFKSENLPVRFYETMNEPWLYFGWNDYTKISYFMALFNAAVGSMKMENPNVLVGFDGTNRKPVLNYWLANGGADLGFISFHKYDEGTIGYYSDATMLNRAETFQLVTSYDYYGVQDSKQAYYNARGKWIPVINSESNYDAACDTGSDPRIQQMIGSVWWALLIRTGVLNGLDYNVYFNFASSASYEYTKSSGGVGFGMVNVDNNNPWYPYYVQKLIGSNLAVGDQIVESTSSSPDIRSLAWVHGDKLNALVICKNDGVGALGLNVYGLQGVLNYSKIDNAVSWQYPRIQTGTMDSTASIAINGYTVMLIQSQIPTSPTPIFSNGFETGNFNAWSATVGAINVASTSPPGAYDGTYYVSGSLKNSGDSSRIIKRLGSTYSALYVRMYVRMEGLFTAGWQGLGPRFSNADNSAAIGYVIVDCTNNKWGIRVLNTGLTNYFEASSSMTIQADRWYCIEFYMSIGPSGTCKLWVDGMLKLTGTYDNDANGNIGCVSAQAYCGTTMATSRTWYGDSFVCATTYI